MSVSDLLAAAYQKMEARSDAWLTNKHFGALSFSMDDLSIFLLCFAISFVITGYLCR
jgi:hypothetical protein